jgi:type II secretion system protein G
MRSTNKKGFTLIELLIVVVIIGILAAIAIPKFANTKEKAYIAAMKSDLRNMATAEESYFADNQTYTTSLTAMNFTASAAVTANVSDAKGTGWAADTKHPATLVTCQVGFGSDSIGGVGDGVIQCK